MQTSFAIEFDSPRLEFQPHALEFNTETRLGHPLHLCINTRKGIDEIPAGHMYLILSGPCIESIAIAKKQTLIGMRQTTAVAIRTS